MQLNAFLSAALQRLRNLPLIVEIIGAIGTVWTIGGGIWLFFAARTGVDSTVLSDTFWSQIFPGLVFYSILTSVTVVQMYRWSRANTGIGRAIGIAACAMALVAIYLVGWNDLKARSRDNLIVAQFHDIERAGCTGDWAASIARFERLEKSPRFEFLKARITKMRNRLGLHDYLKAGLPPHGDSIELNERFVIYGRPTPALDSPEALHAAERWLRPLCYQIWSHRRGKDG